MITFAAAKLAGAALRRVPWQAWALGAGLALIALYGHWRYNAGQAEVQAKFNAYRAEVIGATAVAKQRARAIEETQRQAIQAAADTYAKGLSDAKRKGDAVAAGLRAGNLRLQKHWRVCPDLPGTAGDPGRGDDGAELRAASTGRIVGTGAEADQRVIYLQSLIGSAKHCFVVGP